MENFIIELETLLKSNIETGDKVDDIIDLIEKSKSIIPLTLYVDLINIIYLDNEKYTDNDVLIIIDNYLNSLKI